MKALRPQAMAAIVLLSTITIVALVIGNNDIASFAAGGIIAIASAIVQLDKENGE